MALVGKVNREIVASVNRHGSYAVGLSGEDAGLIRVDQRDPRLGFVGDVRAIDPTIVYRLLREELIPVIATVGVDDDGQAYNVNADTVAGAIAEALDAEKLVYLTDVAGVYGDWPDETSLISRIDVDGLEQLVASGKVSEGMIPKLESCVAALRHGVRRAHILDGRLPHALLLEFFTREGVGTMVHDHEHRASPTISFDEVHALDAEHVMQTYGRLPVAFVRGEGTLLFDSEGTRYLDFLAGPRGDVARPRASGGRRRDRRPGAHAAARLEPLLQRRAAPGRGAPRRAARRRRTRVLRQLRRRGERVRDQAGAPVRPAARRPRALTT